jgi:hypothetical protein
MLGSPPETFAKVLAQDSNLIVSGFFIVENKGSAERRFHTESVKVISGDTS